MKRIASTFERLKHERKKALIPFITAGDPGLEVTRELILEMERKGADLIELGIPFSDSLADGPTIQRSYVRALDREFSLKKILETVKEVRQKTQIPIIFMTSYNPVFRYGETKFLREATRAGVDGLIIPDLPVEAGLEFRASAAENGLDVIYLLAPTSTDERIELVSKVSKGFIYYISVAGITGERKKLSKEIAGKIEKIKTFSSLPVLAGFGISNPKQAKEVSRFSDGVIIGSAIVKLIEESLKSKKETVSKVGSFIKNVRSALDS